MLTRLVGVTEMNVEIKALPVPKQFQLWLLLLIVPVLTGNGPVETYTLDRLLTNARATNPVMEIARAKLSKFEAIFDRAYYAWSPVEGRCAHGTST